MPDQLRVVITAEQLQQLIQTEVDKIPQIVEDRETVAIPLPQKLDEPDPHGCNWAISKTIPGSISYFEAIQLVIRRFRSKYNL